MRLSKRAGLTAVAGTVGLLVGCQHLTKSPSEGGSDECGLGGDCPTHVKACDKPTLMALGHDLDHLEKHIDWFGSATPKSPDVWGQARLTQYREQFEKLMDPASVDNKLQFAAGLQGSLARSDQAFFAQATALSFAAQPKPPVVGSVSSAKSAPELVPVSRDVVVTNTVTDARREGVESTTTEQSTTTLGTPPTPAAPAAAPPPIATIQPAAPGTLIVGGETAISRQAPPATRINVAGGNVAGGIGLEPALIAAQKKRYLDFLNQLRRENEGDDTADSPGYELHLIRVPVSLLPGKRTDEGHGAEVTMSVNPILSPELLPTTFRNLVTNDLVNTLGFPVTKFLDEDRGRPAKQQYLTGDRREALRVLELLKLLGDDEGPPTLVGINSGPVVPVSTRLELGVKQKIQNNSKAQRGLTNLPPIKSEGPQQEPDRVRNLEDMRRQFRPDFTVPTLSYTNAGQDREAFPTSKLIDVYGVVFGFEIAYGARQALARDIEANNYAHLPAVQSYLREEIRAAYQFLAAPANHDLWRCFATPEVVDLIRSQRWEELDDKRRQFREAYRQLSGSKSITLVEVKDENGQAVVKGGKEQYETNPVRDTRQMQITAALAWGILVDSALLTDRLMRDMRETAAAKGKALAGCTAWLPYYLPDPPPDARAAFNEYVALRWPARVFALDPYTQDQNIADQLSTRREMQLALSIAFTNGFIGANTLTRYTRRLEADYETIALNRTQVGFSHGENVFGWRFYPRFQTPDTEGNLTVLLRDQLLGGPNRNALLRQRRLEPGPRECVAVVMMPSFVPYATLDVNTNWFGLANPKHKVLDHTQALKLSRTVQAIKTCGPNAASDAACYRDGEFSRLLRRADQLEARLPTQTLTVPLPAANTLGGFEMFSNGTTDLAPTLYGWYGAPGVVQKGTTTLFLVGDSFSPLHTQVVVGNQPAASALLSRQVMKVTVTGPLQTVTDPATKRVYAQAHVATPYGVTRELLVPVSDAVAPAAEPAPKEGYAVTPATLDLPYCKRGVMDGKGAYTLAVEKAFPADAAVKVKWSDALGSAPKLVKIRLAFAYKDCPFTIEVSAAADNGSYTIGGDQLKEGVIRGVFDHLNQYGPFTDETNPLTGGLKVTAVGIKPDDGRAATWVDASGSLEFRFKCEVCTPNPGVVPGFVPPPPPAPVDPPKPVERKQ